MTLPKVPTRILVPPLKCQGIKTKLIPFILSNVCWDGQGRWIEPFLGSGSVVFNVAPQRAKLNDLNPFIIRLYQSIYDGVITPGLARKYLEQEGALLSKNGAAHYYAVRERFNETGSLLDFLFLNRACFNGVMRFNGKGKFNVPFCKKPERFRPAYITKIVNQIGAIRDVLVGKQWEFSVGDWRETLTGLEAGDFVYLDPPYVGRHTDYYGQWDDQNATILAELAQELPCGIALSMWKANQYRKNLYLDEYWQWAIERTSRHFYHVGPTEDLRNEMEEALMIKSGYAAPLTVQADAPPKLVQGRLEV